MAMSLEDLLAEEGFKRRKPKLNSVAKNSSGPLMIVAKRMGTRTRSDIPRHDPKSEFSPSGSFITSQKTRDDKLERMGKKVDKGYHNATSSRHGSNVPSSKQLVAFEITEVVESDDDIVEAGKNRTFKDVYSNNDVMTRKEDERSMKGRALTSDKRSYKVSEDEKKIDESKRRQDKLYQAPPAVPSLDEIAVKAVVAILKGYAKRFLTDGEFRLSLRHNSFASLNFLGSEEVLNTESQVIENLEQAIETIERAAEEKVSLKEVKRASLQLSVITGLNARDTKEGFTSGIPNFQLSACAHLYLSIVYFMQRKDGISSKHLLQVFRDSPFQSRTVLLPDLWDRLFRAHLLHLKSWYEKEADYMVDSPDCAKIEYLERVYNEVLDKGTREFAMYYKDWITEGVEAPSVPVIEAPISVQMIVKEAFRGHTSTPVSRNLSPQPMVSKRLYDEVFKFSHKSGKKSEVHEQEDIEVVNVRASNSYPAPEDDKAMTYSCTLDVRKNMNLDNEVFLDDRDMKTEARTIHQETPRVAASINEENKSVIRSTENPVVELKQIKESVIVNASSHTLL